MISGFFERLLAAPEAGATDDDARLALSALLVRLARADNDYAQVEVERIDATLMHRYSLTEAEAQALRSDAETLEAQAPDTVRFTRQIKQAVPYEQREAVVEAMWSLALVDDNRDHSEDTFMRMVTNLLGISDVESALARQRAQNMRGG